MKKLHHLFFTLFAILFTCNFYAQTKRKESMKAPFVWENATVYFLLTDRFNNGNPENDVNHNRTKTPGKLRGFEGGDIKGITKKIEEGYFDKLGIKPGNSIVFLEFIWF